VKRGTDALLTVSGADTTAAMSQLSSFIERWKTEHVDAVVLAGSTVVAKPFVQAVRNAFPDITMVADTTDVLSQAQDEAKANVDPNPYDGIITAEGDTGKVHQTRRGGKYCRAIYEKATGKTYPDPNAIYPGKGGKREDLYDETEGACSQVVLFSEIAKRAGKNLNATTWADAVNHFGKLFVTSTLYASLHQGKYDADDTYGLVAYDPSVGAVGDWKRVTPVQDVGNVSP
jgi:hypothetical protein